MKQEAVTVQRSDTETSPGTEIRTRSGLETDPAEGTEQETVKQIATAKRRK